MHEIVLKPEARIPVPNFFRTVDIITPAAIAANAAILAVSANRIPVMVLRHP